MTWTMKFIARISLVACSFSALYSLTLLKVAWDKEETTSKAIKKQITLNVAKRESDAVKAVQSQSQQKPALTPPKIVETDPKLAVGEHNCSETAGGDATDWATCQEIVLNASKAETACVYPNISGDHHLDELLDSMCPIKLPLMDNYRSPCWYEELPLDFKKRYRVMPQMFRDQARRSFQRITPVLEKRAKESPKPWRLRCLPLVYILGVAKSGTSDLFELLLQHPHVVKGATKEPFFWDSTRWNRGARVEDFLNLFDEASEVIRQTTTSNGSHARNYHPVVTIDASVNTLFNFDGSLKLKANKGAMPPQYIAAHMIQNLTPRSNLKIIVIVRNPVERLFSSYVFFNTVTNPSNISADEFHTIASESVKRMDKCLKSKPMRECLYRKIVTKTRKMVDVHAGIYFGYIADWLKVFPNMRVVRMDEYKQNRERVFKDLVQYIGLDPVELHFNQSDIIARGPTRSFAMWNSTRNMLKEFYRPFNEMLANLLKDKLFRYDD